MSDEVEWSDDDYYQEEFGNVNECYNLNEVDVTVEETVNGLAHDDPTIIIPQKEVFGNLDKFHNLNEVDVTVEDSTNGLAHDDPSIITPQKVLEGHMSSTGNSSDSEDVPLARLSNRTHAKKGLGKKTRQKLPSSSELDDDNDTSYIPPQSPESSSDTSVETERKRKWWRKRNKPLRRLGQVDTPRGQRVKKAKQKSKESTKHKKLKSNPMLQSKEEKEMENALRESKESFCINSLRKKMHNKRLNDLLSSNNLSKIEIQPDGNCFFNAVKIQLQTEEYNALSLRSKVCEHLTEHENHYISFLRFPDEKSTEERSLEYAEKVASIEDDGIWNQDLSDVVPLAVANILNQHIRIYSSRISNPIVHIEPNMGDAVDTVSKPLLLAFLAHPGFEHYDAVTNVTGKVTGPISTSTGSPRRKTKTPTKNKGRSPSTTPRKKAEYNSPGKRKTSRKRICDPSKWVKTIRKEQRNMGKRYISPGSKNIIPAKSLKSRDCSDCRYQCSKTLTLDIQQKIFDSFYCKEMTFERKRDFICRHIDVKPTSNRNRKTYKQNARAYYLPCRGKLVRVCKAFFLSTLAVSDKLVRCTLARKEHGIFSGTDQRGKHQPANKTENVRLSYVKLHIESFPAVDSHYKRKSTQRKFLETGLSINRMYDLYREKCENDKVAPVSASVYRNIFCSQYNLSFHKPKKDTCAFCNTYMEKEKSCTATDMDKKSYQDHLRRKEIARTEKEKDKELSKKSKSIYAATFDMQAVLSTPCSNVSKVYYKRKLNCYNMSVFSLSDKSGTCYLWDESNGQRGSSEIGSCLITHINGLPSTVKHVILYSDCCSGQNRNQYLAAGLNHTVNSSHVEIIEQKFLESGHTQMECDSMHSAIEHAKKGTSIFHPDQWDMVVHMARRGKPYTVVPMRFDNIKDLKEYTKQECVGLKFDSEGRRVNWLKIKLLRVAKEFPNGILVKESFEDEDFRFVPLNSKSTRGRPPSVPRPLPNKYTSQLPISVAKKNDLLSLCDNLIIPALYRPFYEGLATNKLLKDRLPEPDMLEDDEDSD